MLNKKLLRDIKKNLSQFITIFLMILIGVMAYSGIKAYMLGMQCASDKFYSDNNLQDLNVIGYNFTKDNLNKVKQIKNVKNAELRLSVNGTYKSSTINLNFIDSNNINKIYVLEGEEYNSNLSGIWLNNSYAKKNNISVGDNIEIEYDNYILTEKVRGLINVPDNLYVLKDESQLVPDYKEYGFSYLSINELKGYIENKIKEEKNIKDDMLKKLDINYKDYIIYNNIIVDVNDKSNCNKVKKKIEEKINTLSVIKIEDTISYSGYQGEIDEGKTYVGVFSGLFIFIALLSVVTTMTRIINKQKLQIGTLKALGFKNKKILIHYINYGLYISIVGAVCGLLLGYYGLGQFFMNMEMDFFEIPNGVVKMDNSSYLISLLVVLSVIIVTYLTVRKHLKKSAAESLRNEIPNVKTRSLNITTKGVLKKLGFSTKWNIRDMLRNKIRTITGIIGIASCSLLLVCAFGMMDTMNHFVDLQFKDLYNFKYKLSIKDNISELNKKDLENKFGTSTSKTLLIETKENGILESNNIFVYDANNLIRFKNNNNKFIKIDRNDGVYITYKLAKSLNKKMGDTISWHIQGSNKYYKSKIVGFNKDPQNQNITMTRKYYESFGFKYKYDTIYTNEPIDISTDIKGVDVISDISKLAESMNSMLSRMMSMVVIIAVVAVVLGMVIIYNTSILSYTEKQYQFSTLKVLGFKDKKIKRIFSEQNIIIGIISIIIGLPGGFYLTDWLFKTAIEESYDFGAYISIRTYLIAAFGTFLAIIIVSFLISKKINKIDMVSSLKANE